MLIKLNILKYVNKLVIMTIFFSLFSCHNSSDISFTNFDILNLAESSYGDEFIVLDVRTKQERANGFLANSTHIDFYDEAFLDKLNLLDKTKPIKIITMILFIPSNLNYFFPTFDSSLQYLVTHRCGWLKPFETLKTCLYPSYQKHQIAFFQCKWDPMEF